jgi:hypothetical protein
MAAYNKFEIFLEHLLNKVHDLFGTGGSADAVKIYLSNTAPNAATHTVKADIAEISAGNGYTAGGESVTPNGTRSGGTVTLTGTKVVWTASGGTIGPFRYVILYNDTPTSPADPLVAWWDRGAELTLQNGETFSVKFNSSDTTGTIFTFV